MGTAVSRNLDLSTNEYCLKFVGKEPVSLNDPFWNRFLAFNITPPTTRNDQLLLESKIEPLCQELLKSNLSSGNLGTLIQLFIARSSELLGATDSEANLFNWQLFNNIFTIRCVVKFLTETTTEDQLLEHIEYNGNGAILESFISSLFTIIVDVPVTDSTYPIHLEAVTCLLVLLSVQFHSGQRSDRSVVYNIVMKGRHVISAPLFVKCLLNNFINQQSAPPGYGNGQGHSLVIGLATELWSILTFSRKTEATDVPEQNDFQGTPLATQSIMLLLVLVHNWTTLNNPFRLSLFSCVNQVDMGKTGLSPLDPSSFSRPELVKVSNIALNLNVNFDRKVLSGSTELTVEKVDKRATEVIFDTLKLKISSIYNVETKEKLKYELGDNVAEYGSKLTVQLPQGDKDSYKIGIEYETDPAATGLQWLSPKATAGKKHPYLFSQFQPTHARSVLPCQDTPGVKTPYTATISAPQEFTVLMSAIRDGTKELHGGKLSHFIQKVPMPSYLIALAVGVLESREIGPRSHVWAEKEIIEECAYEFANTEHQLKTAEELCGPYVWGIYDLLVLPPSFPYGGMENPCLTFVTPTLLAGDRSLANVIAHEIAHSWTGNLVTNRNFEHFWLNEGFTVFIERKIKGRLESAQSQDFDAFTHVSELGETINLMGKTNPLTQLVVDLVGVHPDDAFSTVPYEKGQTFLRHLENVVGGPEKMEPFLRSYFDEYKYKSIDTSAFKSYFENYFSGCEKISNIDWQSWLYSPGMPPLIPDYDKTMAVVCDELIEKFLNWNGEETCPVTTEDKAKLSTSQIIYILQKISEKPAQSIPNLQALNAVFEFDSVKNAEIKFRWLRICLKAHWEEKIDPVFSWINVIGRMKFVRPLYRDLYSWEKTRQKAIENFRANRQNMMHVSAYTLAKDLHIEE